MNVSFPGLGINLEINRTAFELFSYPIYWYGIIIAFGLVMGVLVASVASKKLGESTDIPLDLAIFCGPVAVIFARIYYVVFKLDYYLDNPSDIFNFRAGGIAIYGAVIGAVLAASLYAKYKKYSVLKVYDIGSVGLITGQMIGRWGNFFNQEAFGDNTNLPWGMISENTVSYLGDLKSGGINVDPFMPVHPTFLYESLWCMGVLVVMFAILKNYSYNGQLFFGYASLYGLGRLWIEGLRTDSLMIGPFRVSQMVALFSVLVFGFLYFYNLTKSKARIHSHNCETE